METFRTEIVLFGKCHFRSKSFHYSDNFRSPSHFYLIWGKIEGHVQELQILLYRSVSTASETDTALLPKQLRTESHIFNNLNSRKLRLLEIEASLSEKFDKIAVSVSIAVSSAKRIES